MSLKWPMAWLMPLAPMPADSWSHSHSASVELARMASVSCCTLASARASTCCHLRPACLSCSRWFASSTGSPGSGSSASIVPRPAPPARRRASMLRHAARWACTSLADHDSPGIGVSRRSGGMAANNWRSASRMARSMAIRSCCSGVSSSPPAGVTVLTMRTSYAWCPDGWLELRRGPARRAEPPAGRARRRTRAACVRC